MNEVLKNILTYVIVFGVGGFMCVLAQFLIIKTKLTPARILVLFLVGGMVLETVGVYKYLMQVAQAGISVPIIGFGASLAHGAIDMAREMGFIGAFAGGLTRTAFGVGVAVVASFVISLIFKPKAKKH